MKKRILSIILAAASVLTFSACGASKVDEKPSTPTTDGEISNQSSETKKEIPVFNAGWSNELHTGNMQLAFLIPDEFKNNSIHLNPVSDKQLELVKDGEVIADRKSVV